MLDERLYPDGEKIVEFRKQNNLGQKNLASLAKLSRRMIQIAEQGLKVLPRKSLNKIATALGKTVEEITRPEKKVGSGITIKVDVEEVSPGIQAALTAVVVEAVMRRIGTVPKEGIHVIDKGIGCVKLTFSVPVDQKTAEAIVADIQASIQSGALKHLKVVDVWLDKQQPTSPSSTTIAKQNDDNKDDVAPSHIAPVEVKQFQEGGTKDSRSIQEPGWVYWIARHWLTKAALFLVMVGSIVLMLYLMINREHDNRDIGRQVAPLPGMWEKVFFEDFESTATSLKPLPDGWSGNGLRVFKGDKGQKAYLGIEEEAGVATLPSYKFRSYFQVHGAYKLKSGSQILMIELGGREDGKVKIDTVMFKSSSIVINGKMEAIRFDNVGKTTLFQVVRTGGQLRVLIDDRWEYSAESHVGKNAEYNQIQITMMKMAENDSPALYYLGLKIIDAE